MTPLKAIRAKCLDCCCGSAFEVKLCACKDCSLWPFRDGRNPARKGVGNPSAFQKPDSSAGITEAEADHDAE